MAEAIEEANQGVKRTLKDLFGGAVGGVAQVLIGMSLSYSLDCTSQYEPTSCLHSSPITYKCLAMAFWDDMRILSEHALARRGSIQNAHFISY